MKVLEEYQKLKNPGKPPLNSGKYDWSEYFDGQAREFDQGLDFEGSARSFSQTARAAAKSRGIEILVSFNNADGIVRLQAFPNGGGK